MTLSLKEELFKDIYLELYHFDKEEFPLTIKDIDAFVNLNVAEEYDDEALAQFRTWVDETKQKRYDNAK